MMTICSKCGQSFEKQYVNENHKINIKFEYCSIYDGQEWEFHLCDDCLTEIVKGFIHTPKGFMEYGHQEYWDALQEAYAGNTYMREGLVV